MKVAVVVAQEPEIEGMVHWAVLFARSFQSQRKASADPASEDANADSEAAAIELTVLVGDAVKTKTIRAEVDAWQLAHGESVEADCIKIEGDSGRCGDWCRSSIDAVDV
jgi:hypothetical protein